MNRKWTYSLAVVAVALGVVFSSGCEKLRARDQLNKGVQAFRNAKYTEAVEKFKTAVELDPTFQTARLYLAMAYFQQYIPGAVSPENMQMVRAAKEQFNKVLETDPNNTVALASIAQLNYSETQGISDLTEKNKKLDESREWYERLTKADPKYKEAFYSLGVITWGKWYPILGKARADMSMKPEDPGPLKDKKVRADLRTKYWDMINDGIKNLDHSLELDPKYDDAMAYLNLLYRERADLADTPEEYKADIAQADAWLQKTLDTRKAKAGALPATVTPASDSGK
jgi:tetratricopeptide (TPR) repeat protein